MNAKQMIESVVEGNSPKKVLKQNTALIPMDKSSKIKSLAKNMKAVVALGKPENGWSTFTFKSESTASDFIDEVSAIYQGALKYVQQGKNAKEVKIQFVNYR